jgi:hypothetical protein
MENVIVKVVNKTAHILGDFDPGTLLVSSESGAKLLVVGRRREMDPRYVELLKIAREFAEGVPEMFSISTALVVSAAVPRPGDDVQSLTGSDSIIAALQKCADAMVMLDVIRTTEFVKVLKEEIGGVAFNALKEVVKKDEDRMAAAMMYLLQALETATVALNYELPKVAAIKLLDFRSLFAVSDYMLAVVSYVFRLLIEAREDALVVVEETPKFLTDDAARRNLALFLSQARKFGVQGILVSQVPDELMQNTRLVVGKVGNPSYARKVAELSPQMPTAVAKLLPQLSRGQFVHIDASGRSPSAWWYDSRWHDSLRRG